MATSRRANLSASAVWIGMVVYVLVGCPAHVPLQERRPKPEQRFAYSVNVMPDSPQKRVLVMEYSLFLDRTRLMNKKYERRELARLDVIQDSVALNAFWQAHFADMDPYPTTQRNEWFDDLARAAEFAGKYPFDCFHFMQPDPKGVVKDPDDMLDPLGELIARLGPPLSWTYTPEESAGALTCIFTGDELIEREFAKDEYKYRQWKEFLPGPAAVINKAKSAPKIATPYPFEQLRPGDVVIDAIPEPDRARLRYHMRLDWKVRARTFTTPERPQVAALRYHYVISAPNGALLDERTGAIADSLREPPAEEDALYFSVVSFPFYRMGNPRGDANGQYRLGIDISDLNSDTAAQRHLSHVEYFTMDVDRMVPTERAWVVGAAGLPDVYNRLTQGDNVLEFPAHFISNDSVVTRPERDAHTGMYECAAVLELIRSRGGAGSASSPDETPILYLPWDNQMTALDSIMNEAARTGSIPTSYRARVPVDPESKEFEWRILDVPEPVREYLKKELERGKTTPPTRTYRVSTRLAASRPDSTIQITFPITAIGRPRERQNPADFVEPGDYNLIGYIWPADNAQRYSPLTSKKDAMPIPYQRIRVPVKVAP